MRFVSRFILTIGIFTCVNVFGQKAETEKAIAGCWKIVDFTLQPEPSDIDKIKKEALGGVVCFDNGRFESKAANGTRTGSGTFSISSDGKKISQKTDGMPDHMDEPDGTIQTLTKTELVVQAAEVTMRLARVEP